MPDKSSPLDAIPSRLQIVLVPLTARRRLRPSVKTGPITSLNKTTSVTPLLKNNIDATETTGHFLISAQYRNYWVNCSCHLSGHNVERSSNFNQLDRQRTVVSAFITTLNDMYTLLSITSQEPC